MCTRNKSHKKLSKGFTLLELMLVLAAIAVLGISAFVIYPKVQTANKGQQDRSNVRLAASQINALFPAGNPDNDTIFAVLMNKPSYFGPLCDQSRSGGDGAYGWCWSAFDMPVSIAIMGGDGYPISGFAFEFEDVTPEECMALMKDGIQALGENATDSYSYASGEELDIGSSVEDRVKFCGTNPGEIDVSYWPTQRLW